ncbi:MAG: hypothetical protein WD993_02245 [Thermoleophilaceae bacterium]
MNDLLQDLWYDLREKRLLPVVLVLALGIVAIPAVMMKSSAPAPTPTATVAPAEEEAPRVELHTENASASGKGSSLDVLAERNPFKPPKSVTSTGGSATASSATAGASDEGSDEGSGGSGEAGSGGDATGDSGDGGSVTPAPEPVPDPVTTAYSYVADVTFWNGNQRRTIKGLRKLDMLPSQAAPVLIFMGTGPKGGNAVFLVDSTLKAAGEGRCKPGPANCAFVQIGPGSEHAFTTEAGDSYRIRIDEIRRVKAGARATASERDRSGEVFASTEQGRRFTLPTLIDLVEVTAVEETASVVAPPSDDQTTSR